MADWQNYRSFYDMIKPKFCRDCTWSIPEKNSAWNLVCTNPLILGQDEWELSRTDARGSSCRDERSKGFWKFPFCGKYGKLWIKKSTVESAVK